MIRRDMPEVLAINSAVFDNPWCDDDFTTVLRRRNCIGMVAQNGGDHPSDGPIVGFMVYELDKRKITLLHMGVHPDYQRRGVGGSLIRKLVSKLSLTRRSTIDTTIRETNLGACFFLRHMGFIAIGLEHGTFIDSDEDLIVFDYEYSEQSAKKLMGAVR
jgi:ribosomal-protein-alanine N-acetyltransferase